MSYNSAEAAKFLSTPSARRATDNKSVFLKALRISIHALREEGDRSRDKGRRQRQHFYPRPPRGGRPDRVKEEPSPEQFLSTPSARRATLRCAESAEAQTDFYPRPPRGGRP